MSMSYEELDALNTEQFEEIHELTEKLKAADAELVDAQQRFVDASGERDDLKKLLTAAEESRDRLQREVQRLGMNEAALMEQRAFAVQDREKAQAELKKTQADYAACAGERERALLELGKVQASLATTEAAWREAESAAEESRDRLQAKVESLEKDRRSSNEHALAAIRERDKTNQKANELRADLRKVRQEKREVVGRLQEALEALKWKEVTQGAQVIALRGAEVFGISSRSGVVNVHPEEVREREPFDFAGYLREVKRTAAAQTGREALITFGLGIAGEAGEVADLVKKHVGHGHPLDREKLKKELGDVLWYVTALADLDGLTLEDVARANVEKLRARYANGFSTEASLKRVDVRGCAHPDQECGPDVAGCLQEHPRL